MQVLKMVCLCVALLQFSSCGSAPKNDANAIIANQVDAESPNILLIISDDQGLDSSAQYGLTKDPPNTPRLNALAQAGLVFDSAHFFQLQFCIDW